MYFSKKNSKNGLLYFEGIIIPNRKAESYYVPKNNKCYLPIKKIN